MRETKEPDSFLPDEVIYQRLFSIRKQRVILDFDIAELYGVEVKVLKQSVRRNLNRFPKDFMFELTEREWLNIRKSVSNSDNISLRSQIVTLKVGNRGQHSKYKPFAFTEQGVAMLSSVLNNPQAIAVNIQIMRIFVRMRQMIVQYADLLEKIEKLETAQIENNDQIAQIYQIIKGLLEPAIKDRPPLGFRLKGDKGGEQ